jgi:hypothetical protein
VYTPIFPVKAILPFPAATGRRGFSQVTVGRVMTVADVVVVVEEALAEVVAELYFEGFGPVVVVAAWVDVDVVGPTEVVGASADDVVENCGCSGAAFGLTATRLV